MVMLFDPTDRCDARLHSRRRRSPRSVTLQTEMSTSCTSTESMSSKLSSSQTKTKPATGKYERISE
ncbi:unnamed protein product [Hymenolepis diminuta]|uniref:Uncharacterized protein n=1 Tax=Hymenolepis diminuta TaxID=6216 RepID=A0A564YZT0_HYMDI|nr:unnamed protein product [Hymenolepis diminuta]